MPGALNLNHRLGVWVVVVCFFFVCLSQVPCQPSVVSSVVYGVRTKDCIKSRQIRSVVEQSCTLLFSISFALLNICIVSLVWKGRSSCESAGRDFQKKWRLEVLSQTRLEGLAWGIAT